MREHYMQKTVGHYGVFNCSRFRSEIVPRIVDFINANGGRKREPAKPRLVSSSSR
jgi:poly(3-hydroxybutyrate) depolymerase